jgi:hypothetical protein
MFHELLENPKRLEPGPLQSDARRLFPAIVQRSHLEQHVPGSAVPTTGKYVIIGVATYSPDELRLLDDLEAAHARWGGTSKVVVFDVLDCNDMNDMRKHVPSLMVVVQTPVVAFWDGGKLVASQTGLHLRHEVLHKAGLLK